MSPIFLQLTREARSGTGSLWIGAFHIITLERTAEGATRVVRDIFDDAREAGLLYPDTQKR